MRKVSTVADEAYARRVVDALLVEGIEADARGTEVWVLDDKNVEAARARLDAFARDGIPDAGKVARRLRERKKLEQQDWAQRSRNVAQHWRLSSLREQGFGPLTLMLIIASVVVALLGAYGPPDDTRMWNVTIDDWASRVPLQKVREGEVWRIFTPIFLHFGIIHLVFNMLWLRSLGTLIERNDGWVVFVPLVLASAAVGNLAQYYVSGPGFGGMSGVVYALFGFVWMQSRYRPARAYAMAPRSALWMMGWFVLCATGLVGSIANLGHAGGLVVGLLFGVPAWVVHLRARTTRPTYEHEGAWAQVSLSRWVRFRRRVVDPFVPLWFLLIALAVAWAEPNRSDQFEERVCAQRTAMLWEACLAEYEARGQVQLLYDAYADAMADHLPAEDGTMPPDATVPTCSDMLEAMEHLADELQCGR